MTLWVCILNNPNVHLLLVMQPLGWLGKLFLDPCDFNLSEFIFCSSLAYLFNCLKGKYILQITNFHGEKDAISLEFGVLLKQTHLFLVVPISARQLYPPRQSWQVHDKIKSAKWWPTRTGPLPMCPDGCPYSLLDLLNAPELWSADAEGLFCGLFWMVLDAHGFHIKPVVQKEPAKSWVIRVHLSKSKLNLAVWPVWPMKKHLSQWASLVRWRMNH